MEKLSRKEREYRDREARILSVAGEMLRRDGYLKLNMDRVGQAIEYAKGTVYRHFDNKEDIIVALGVQMFAHEVSLFSRAASLQTISRERFMACGVALELHNRLYPEHMQINRICGTPSLFEKARPERQTELRSLEGQCMATIATICQDALRAGELVLGPDVTPEMVIFGPWATFTGAQVLMDANIPLVEKGIADVQATLWLAVQRMIDGFGWRPLSIEHDYSCVRRRVLTELFAVEVEALSARGEQLA